MARELDYEREGLLDGLDHADKDARRDLLRQLTEAGVELEELKQAVREDRLATLPWELAYTRDCRHTLREMIEEVGVREEFVTRNYLALGLPVPDLDEPSLNDEDVSTWRMLKALFDAGVSEDIVLELARLGGRGAAQMAEALLDTFARRFLKPGDTERDFGLRLANLADDLSPALGPLMEAPVRWHMRQRVRHEALTKAQRASGRMPGTRDVGVCFADLVEFTGLSEAASTDELLEVTTSLETLATEVAAPPVRLIKLIGDGAMLVSPDALALVKAAEMLVIRARADSVLPELHVGIAFGPAIHRGGDWYGPTVNLASRISDAAPPDAVLASGEVVLRCGAEREWSDYGARALKGVKPDVHLHRLTVGPAAGA